MTGGAVAGTAGLFGVGAVLSAGLAARLLTGWSGQRRRVRQVFAAGGAVLTAEARPGSVRGMWPDRARVWWRTRVYGQLGPEWLCLPVGGVVGRLGESVLPLLAALAAVPLVRRWLRRREAAGSRDRREAEVIDLCAAVAGELRAGRQPVEALLAAEPVGRGAVEPSVAAAARYGGDVPAALRRVARRPGAEGMVGVAACWQAAADTGAGLAAGLERVAVALRAEREQRDELRAQLAGTRSTALLLALLPAFGLLMGSALGAEPLRVLLHTPAGLCCLLVGGLLESVGLTWTARIVRDAGGRPVRTPPPDSRRGGRTSRMGTAAAATDPGAGGPLPAGHGHGLVGARESGPVARGPRRSGRCV